MVISNKGVLMLVLTSACIIMLYILHDKPIGSAEDHSRSKLFQLAKFSAPVSSSTSRNSGHHQHGGQVNGFNFTALDPKFLIWRRRLMKKLSCSEHFYSLVYLYHTRRAAGTTLQDVIRSSSHRLRQTYITTDGLRLNPELLNHPQMLSVTTLRHPVTRILSLYWYEHVAWHMGTLRQEGRCRTLTEWLDAWQEGGDLQKQAFLENPRGNFIEVDNYYVKAFSRWNGSEPLSDRHYEQAKQALLDFDLVLISEWLGDETEIDAINIVFPGRPSLATGGKMRGNKKLQESLKSTLIPDESTAIKRLQQMNTWDMQLYDFAQSLAAWRLKHVVPLLKHLKGDLQVHGVHHDHSQLLQPDEQHYGSSLDPDISTKDCAESKELLDSTLQRFKDDLGSYKPSNCKGP